MKRLTAIILSLLICSSLFVQVQAGEGAEAVLSGTVTGISADGLVSVAVSIDVQGAEVGGIHVRMSYDRTAFSCLSASGDSAFPTADVCPDGDNGEISFLWHDINSTRTGRIALFTAILQINENASGDAYLLSLYCDELYDNTTEMTDIPCESEDITVSSGSLFTITAVSDFLFPSQVYDAAIDEGECQITARAPLGETAFGEQGGMVSVNSVCNRYMPITGQEILSFRFENKDAAKGITLQGIINGTYTLPQECLLAYDRNKKKWDFYIDDEGRAVVPADFNGYIVFDLSGIDLPSLTEWEVLISWASPEAREAFEGPYTFAISDITMGEDLLSLGFVKFGTYRVDYHSELILGIAPGTTARAFTDALNAETVRVSKQGESVSPSSIVTTDMDVAVNENTYKIVVMGDVDCNGAVSAGDIILVRKLLLQITELTSAQNAAAIMTPGQNRTVTIKDLVALKKYIVKN